MLINAKLYFSFGLYDLGIDLYVNSRTRSPKLLHHFFIFWVLVDSLEVGGQTSGKEKNIKTANNLISPRLDKGSQNNTKVFTYNFHAGRME